MKNYRTVFRCVLFSCPSVLKALVIKCVPIVVLLANVHCPAMAMLHFEEPLSANLVQAKQIEGRVTDQNGAALTGVTVTVKGTSAVAITDETGVYRIVVPESGTVLVFTIVGFEPIERAINNDAIVNVSMTTSISDLDEVIVIGYGEVARKDLTGSVGSADVAAIQRAPVASLDQALAGRVAGVQVFANDGQPGADLNIIIRGNNSITQDNSPLYVVDGFPIETSLNSVLNMSDIASIEVLKDASATAIYGARAANGVVIITTKTGKPGGLSVSYENFLASQKVLRTMDLLSPYEFVKYQVEYSPLSMGEVYLSNGTTLDDYRNANPIDWQDLIFKRAFMQNHNLSLNGGDEKTTYFVSGSIMTQGGVIQNSGFNRYQGRVKLDHKINNKVRVGINANYTSTKKYGTIASDFGSATASIMYSIWGYRNVDAIGINDSDLLNEPLDPEVNPETDYRFNPTFTVANQFNPTFSNTLLTNVYVEYQPIKNLKIKSFGGITTGTSDSQIFNNSMTQQGRGINGVNGSITHRVRNNYVNENTITYQLKKKNHSLSVLGGITIQRVTYGTSGFTAVQIPNESLGISGLEEGAITRAVSSETVNTLASFLGRINYNFKSRYLFTASIRSDGSSKFYHTNRWATFPSGAFAWRFADEPLFADASFLSDGKIRVGYGLTGNNRVSDFAYLSRFGIQSTTGYSIANSPYSGMVPTEVGNIDLRWETTRQLDIGVDLGFWRDRLGLTVDYYEKRTTDLLLNAKLPPSMGYLTGMKNIGEVENKGIEVSIHAQPVVKGNFKWHTDFNISFNRNKVIKLNSDVPSLLTPVSWGNYNAIPGYIAIPGKPIALFYGFVFDGVYQYDDFDQTIDNAYVLKSDIPNNGQPRAQIQPGDVKYKDLDNDGDVDGEDQKIIGDPNPKFIGGLANNFTYKNFDLNVFFQWSYGNEIQNANRIMFEGGEARANLNQFASFADRWTSENQTNELFRVGGAGNRVYSSRTIEDGSFLRLKTVALGYTLPSNLLSRVRISNMRLFLSAQNLITWTRYSGMDPEVSIRNSALTPGFDLSAYPQVRTLTFGVNISL